MIPAETFTVLHNAIVSSDSNSTAVDVTAFTGPVSVRLFGCPSVGDGQGCAVKLRQGTAATNATTDVVGGGFTALGTAATAQTLTIGKGVLGKFLSLNFDISGNNSPAYVVVSEIVGRGSRNPAS